MTTTAKTKSTDKNAGSGASASNAPAPAFTHRVAGVAEHGFYRGGRHWPREGVDVNRTDFTDEQWDAIEAESRLVVVAL